MAKGKAKLGDYKVVCDRTGFIKLASECKMQWNGLFVRDKSWERRHPGDFIPPFYDKQSVPIPRPEGTDKFLTTNEVTEDDL